VAHKQSSFSEQDIVGLVLADEPDNLPHYRLASLHVVCGTVESPTATVQLIGRNGNLYTGEDGGVGPVDAISKAIRKTVAVPIQLIEIAISAMTQGTLAHAEVTVYVREEPEALVTEHNDEPPAVYCGYATNLDTVVATAEAYLDALNQLLAARQQRKQRSVAQMRAAQALLDHEHE
jgi:2-isopropylmalate synthase